jgi:hypothetical protein
MRVAAFWAAVAGLVALAGRAAVLAMSLTDAGGEEARRIAAQVAAWGELAFLLLMVVFLLMVALTGRKVAA